IRTGVTEVEWAYAVATEVVVEQLARIPLAVVVLVIEAQPVQVLVTRPPPAGIVGTASLERLLQRRTFTCVEANEVVDDVLGLHVSHDGFLTFDQVSGTREPVLIDNAI